MTLFRLSLRNAQRQARDYLVYFVTIVMAAALSYAFNGLVFSEEIQTLASALKALPVIIVLASIVVVCIIGWLVQYTIRFMLARRSRELGTYILIGLESRQVARLFFLENLAVGGAAVLLGLLAGNFLFQALRAVILTLFGQPYAFQFSFSLKTVGLTLFYFALVYLLALFRSSRRIRTMKICGLIYLDRQNETDVIKKGRIRRKIFIISIILGVLGTFLLMMGSATPGILGACLIIAFLYGFFISFSSGVPAYFNKRAERKYKGNTLLIFRGLSAKLATMGAVMATIALLFTATLISEGTGMVFSSIFQSRSRQTTCFDLFIGSSTVEEHWFDSYLDYIDSSIPIRLSQRYSIYQGGSAQVTEYIEAHEKYIPLFPYDTLMKASDYAALRAMLGYSEAALEPGHYLIHCMPYLEKRMSGYSQTITVNQNELAPGGVYSESFTQSLWDGNGRGFILVVPDEAAVSRPVSHSIYAAMTEEPVSEAACQALRAIKEKQPYAAGSESDTFLCKSEIEAESASMYALFVLPLYYLAIVLTLVSATILTIQQLSETRRYQRQFELLDKLGMDRQEMKRTLGRQFAIYYTLPAVPPLLISVPFLLSLIGALEPGVITGHGGILLLLGSAFGLFFFIYLIYILVAYTSLKRNVLPW